MNLVSRCELQHPGTTGIRFDELVDVGFPKPSLDLVWATPNCTRLGYDYVHSAIDAHSRLVFSEILGDEKGPTCAGFFERAETFFWDHGISIEAVLTDNAKNYLGVDFSEALGRVDHRRILPRRPQTNGKVCEYVGRRSTARPDPGKGLTKVSFVLCVGRGRCCVTAHRLTALTG
jgi:transposase InsO family protein